MVIYDITQYLDNFNNRGVIMKVLHVVALLAITSCGCYQPVAQTTALRAVKVIVSNPNAKKVIHQLSELHKAKGVHNFVETRRALGGVISDHAGNELYHTFVQQRYQTTILDLYRSYTEDHLNALNRAIDNLAKATSRRKVDSHVQEIRGLMKSINSKVKARDTVFRLVMPHSHRATNIRNKIDEFVIWQRNEMTSELQKNLTKAISQTLNNSSKRDQPALLIIGEGLWQNLKWLFY